MNSIEKAKALLAAASNRPRPGPHVCERDCPCRPGLYAQIQLENRAPDLLAWAIGAVEALAMADAKLGGGGQEDTCGFHESIPERQAIDKAVAEFEKLFPEEDK